MTDLEKIRSLLAEGKKLEDVAHVGPWHIGHVNENDDSCDIDAPNGETVATVHYRQDSGFICDSRTRVSRQRKCIEVLLEGLKAECFCSKDESCRPCDVISQALAALEGGE